MANNELSGPVVATYIAKWLLQQSRKYTYRILLIPETIGSIAYISEHIERLKQKTLVGFTLTCIGDELNYSYVATKYENTYADKIVSNVLKFHFPIHTKYSFLSRGSDERQFCSPGVDLPLVALCRSKFGE